MAQIIFTKVRQSVKICDTGQTNISSKNSYNISKSLDNGHPQCKEKRGKEQ